MIALPLIFAVLQPSPVKVVEIPIKDEVDVLSIYMSAPDEMSGREIAQWNILARSLSEGTMKYTRDQILFYGGQGGYAPRVTWTNDWLSIRFVMPRDQLGTAVQMAASMLREPYVSEDMRARLKEEMSRPLDDDLSAKLKGKLGDLEHISESELGHMWRMAYRPDKLSIAVTSGSQAGISAAQVQQAFADWRPKEEKPDYRSLDAAKFAGPGKASVTFWNGAPVIPTEKNAAAVLAMFALGVGKESSAFKIVRQDMGATYRQDALFYPAKTGWRPMMLLAGSKPINTAEIRTKLSKATEAWTSDDLVRAQALAGSSLQGRCPFSPFMVNGVSTFGGTEIERVEWAAYWGMNGLAQVTPDDLSVLLDNVKLEDMKAAGKSFVDSAIPQ